MHIPKLIKRSAALWLCLSVLPAMLWAQQEASDSEAAVPAEQRETGPASESESEKPGTEPEGKSAPPAPRAFKPSEEVHADTILTMPADF